MMENNLIDKQEQLLNAATLGDNEGVKRLLSQGSDIQSEKDGVTGLHFSAAEGHNEVVLTFLNHGLDVNIRGLGSCPPLMEAAHYGHLSTVRLFDRGACMDVTSDLGNTSLGMAVEENQSYVVRELLTRGANVGKLKGDGIRKLVALVNVIRM